MNTPDTRDTTDTTKTPVTAPKPEAERAKPAPDLPMEIGGAPGADPTRYGDWSHKGRCTDF